MHLNFGTDMHEQACGCRVYTVAFGLFLMDYSLSFVISHQFWGIQSSMICMVNHTCSQKCIMQLATSCLLSICRVALFTPLTS